MGILSVIVGGLGSFFKGLFGLKESQANIIAQAMKVAGDVNSSEAQREVAQAQILVAELQSESWLARNWRPMFMVTCIIIVISYWFGYVPPHLLQEMPPMIAEIFSLIKIGLGGYIGARSVEKIFNTLNLGKVLKTFIEKKIT